MAVGLPFPIPGMGAPAAPPGTPPQGASPATTPVPNKGLEVAGLAELSQVVRQLESLVPKLGIASEAGRAVAEAALKLAKHVPPGATAPGAQTSALQAMMARQRQLAPFLAARGATPTLAPTTPSPPAAA